MFLNIPPVLLPPPDGLRWDAPSSTTEAATALPLRTLLDFPTGRPLDPRLFDARERPSRLAEPLPHSPRRLLSVTDLMNEPDPDWLVQAVLASGAIGVLYGPPGQGKTFVALGIALNVARGEDWHGRAVKRGGVLYIAAEGQRGLKKRIAAALRHGSLDAARLSDVRFHMEPVDLRSEPAVAWVLDVVRANGIRLVVVDTLAHCMPGVDENTVKDIQHVIRGLQRITGTGAAVLVLHHSTKASAQTERGSGALRAAADTMLAVSGSDGAVVVSNNKQKDEEAAPDLHLRLLRVVLGTDLQGAEVSSCVLVRADDGDVDAEPRSARAGHEDRIVRALQKASEGLRFKDLCRTAGVRDGQAGVILRRLQDAGRVTKGAGSRDPWMLTPALADVA